MNDRLTMKISNFAYAMIATTGLVVILIYGKPILLPLVLAIIVWYILKSIRDQVKKIKIRQRRLPIWLSNTLSFVFFFLIMGLTARLLSNSILNLSKNLPVYEENINLITAELNNLLNIDIVNWGKDFFKDFDFSGILQTVFNGISTLFADAFLVLLYVVFLMIEEVAFPAKLKAIFSTPEKFESAHKMLNELNKSLNQYLVLKTIISLITGVLSYVALLIIGIDSPFFWAFLIFLLNYIPTIGSLIATIFPALMALLQTGSFTPFFLVLASVGVIQVLVGNVLEPKMMGDSLNISSLVVLLALAFWGSLWGVTGMILSVPVTVMMIIIFAKFDATRNIAIMLSGNGRV